jgi:hypothetical protein
MEWRRANVKFLKKFNKTNYNLPSFYRPISLTSVVVKMMERIETAILDMQMSKLPMISGYDVPSE